MTSVFSLSMSFCLSGSGRDSGDCEDGTLGW